MKKDKIYVQGGFYATLDRFALVAPTKDLPHIWRDPKQAPILTEHHSHTYLVGSDLKTLTLVRESWRAKGVEAPQTVTLDDDSVRELKNSIAKNIYYN